MPSEWPRAAAAAAAAAAAPANLPPPMSARAAVRRAAAACCRGASTAFVAIGFRVSCPGRRPGTPARRWRDGLGDGLRLPSRRVRPRRERARALVSQAAGLEDLRASPQGKKT